MADGIRLQYVTQTWLRKVRYMVPPRHCRASKRSAADDARSLAASASIAEGLAMISVPWATGMS